MNCINVSRYLYWRYMYQYRFNISLKYRASVSIYSLFEVSRIDLLKNWVSRPSLPATGILTDSLLRASICRPVNLRNPIWHTVWQPGARELHLDQSSRIEELPSIHHPGSQFQSRNSLFKRLWQYLNDTTLLLLILTPFLWGWGYSNCQTAVGGGFPVRVRILQLLNSSLNIVTLLFVVLVRLH